MAPNYGFGSRKTPSEDFSLGYQYGWVERGRQRDIEADKLKALIALLGSRLRQATVRADKANERAEAAEKQLAK